MKKIALIALAAASLGAMAAPAAAQGYDRHDGRYDSRWNGWDRSERGNYNINKRQRQLDNYIDAGIRRGSITRREAANLRAEFREIARIEARYRYRGLSSWERADLDRRFDRLEARIRHDRTDSQKRFGYNDRRY